MERIGNVLNVPLTYFYAADEDEAKLLVSFYRMSPDKRNALLEVAAEFADASDS
jgi:hypothetical protein